MVCIRYHNGIAICYDNVYWNRTLLSGMDWNEKFAIHLIYFIARAKRVVLGGVWVVLAGWLAGWRAGWRAGSPGSPLCLAGWMAGWLAWLAWQYVHFKVFVCANNLIFFLYLQII